MVSFWLPQRKFSQNEALTVPQVIKICENTEDVLSSWWPTIHLAATTIGCFLLIVLGKTKLRHNLELLPFEEPKSPPWQSLRTFCRGPRGPILGAPARPSLQNLAEKRSFCRKRVKDSLWFQQKCPWIAVCWSISICQYFCVCLSTDNSKICSPSPNEPSFGGWRGIYQGKKPHDPQFSALQDFIRFAGRLLQDLQSCRPLSSMHSSNRRHTRESRVDGLKGLVKSPGAPHQEQEKSVVKKRLQSRFCLSPTQKQALSTILRTGGVYRETHKPVWGLDPPQTQPSSKPDYLFMFPLTKASLCYPMRPYI